MNDIIQTLVQSITAGAYPAPTTGTYSPCFVTGPGGTSVTTIRHLKKELMLHGVQHVRLLAVDSNDAENSRFLSQIPPLEMDRELKILDQVEALRMLANAQKGTANRHILEWLPDDRKSTRLNSSH